MIVVGGGAAAAAGRALWRISRGVDQMLDDWRGEVERPGVPERPGVMARLGGIEQTLAGFDARLHGVEDQLRPNGGGSLHDKVTAIQRQTCPGRED